MRTRLLTAILAIAAAGCHPRQRMPATESTWRAGTSPSPTDPARIDENCGPLGQPIIHGSHKCWIGPTRMVAYDQFVLEHSSLHKIPLWVAERLTPAELAGSIPRVGTFFAEPSLPPGERAEVRDYRLSGYHAGHMAAVGNQTVDAQLKKETFTLANMVPQSIQQNLEIWDNLEDTTREWARAGDVYMITGPLFWDPKEDSPETADGWVEYRSLGPNRVSVPTHTYKIAARQSADGGWRLIAFLVANDGRFARPWRLSDYVVPVDFIEAHTGIDFFPRGGAEIERLESLVSPMWEPS